MNSLMLNQLNRIPKWILLSASVALAACGGDGSGADGSGGGPVVFPGILESRSGVTQEGNLQLDGARALASFRIDSTSYLAMASSRAGGVSIFNIGDDGLLNNVLNSHSPSTESDRARYQLHCQNLWFARSCYSLLRERSFDVAITSAHV